MNIVTIKAKALLAAKQIENELGDGCTGCDMFAIIEKHFTPNSEANKDLLEALNALKQANETLQTIANFAVGHGDICEIIARRARTELTEASKILDKYPNLK